MSFSEMEEFPRSSQRHVVCFTHDEYSHIAPMFALARALTGQGLRVTCALPRSSYDSYSETFSSSGHSEPSDTQLHVEPVEELHEHASKDFVQLQQKLREGLMHLMQRLQPPPSFLVADLLYSMWALEVAEHFCVPLFLFSVFPATSLLFSCHLPELIQRGLLPFRPGSEDEIIDWIPGLMKGAQVRDIPIAFLGSSLDWLKELQCREWRECAGLVLGNSSVVLPPEADAVDAISAWGARIYPVGPMLQADLHSKGSVVTCEDETCVKWLNEQPPASVVFASFGGIISLTAEEVREVAQGLEECGQPFLWALRAVEGFPNAASALPEGFLERVSGRGLVVAWAPQRAILSHPSVGCFLFHSGASSALEGIWAGVPMIGGFYKFSDQNTVNLLLADGCGVLFSLTRSEPHDPANRRSSLAAAIKEVLFGQGAGAAIRQRVSQLKAAMREAAGPGGSARRSLEQVVDVLLSPSSSNSHPELDLRGDASFSTHAHAHAHAPAHVE